MTTKILIKDVKKAISKKDKPFLYKFAKSKGVDVKNHYKVMMYIIKFAKTNKDKNWIYDFCSLRYNKMIDHKPFKVSDIYDAIQFAKYQKQKGYIQTNYGKILILGNKNIYWCSPVYGHYDYNKCMAMKNSEKNIKASILINHYLQCL